MAGPGLKEICGSLGIPPVLHMGSCVDNARILQLAALLANELGADISDLPLAGSSPAWYSEKAAAIGTYCVASGIYVHLGHPPNITGSEMVTNLAIEGLDSLLGACFDSLLGRDRRHGQAAWRCVLRELGLRARGQERGDGQQETCNRGSHVSCILWGSLADSPS